MKLEICIQEEICISESVGEIMAFLQKIVEKVMSGELQTPISITIDLPKSNSPPTIGINVSDVMDIGEALG